MVPVSGGRVRRGAEVAVHDQGPVARDFLDVAAAVLRVGKCIRNLVDPPVQGYPYTAEQLKPLKAPQQPAPATDDGPSPSAFIIAGVALIALLGAGIALVKVSRSGRVTPTSA